MTAQQLNDEFAIAESLLKRCRCGGSVALHYEPGCTSVQCLREAKTVMAMPDWCPTEILEKWNTPNESQAN